MIELTKKEQYNTLLKELEKIKSIDISKLSDDEKGTLPYRKKQIMRDIKKIEKELKIK